MDHTWTITWTTDLVIKSFPSRPNRRIGTLHKLHVKYLEVTSGGLNF